MKLRIAAAEPGRVDWATTLSVAVAERDGARKRIREEWATLSVQEMRHLESVLHRAEEAIKAAHGAGYWE